MKKCNHIKCIRSLTISFLILITISNSIGQQVADSFFNSSITNPAFSNNHLRVWIDDSHNNAFGMNFKMEGFVKLLQNDGYEVIADTSNIFTLNTLNKYDILVIGGALGNNITDSIQAFTLNEMTAIYNWVLQGGSLLLLTDHPPFDTSASLLVQKLGGKCGIGIVQDTVNYFATGITGNQFKSWIVFSNKNEGLGKHPILLGRNEKENVHEILTQGGGSVSGPPGSSDILKFSKYAENQKHRTGFGPSAFQKAQMVAFTLGKGRVVISADATFFSTQKVTTKEGLSFYLGMSRTDFDNRQLVLNIMHWLSRLIGE